MEQYSGILCNKFRIITIYYKRFVLNINVAGNTAVNIRDIDIVLQSVMYI